MINTCNVSVGSFTVTAVDGIQEIKLDNATKTQILPSPIQHDTLYYVSEENRALK